MNKTINFTQKNKYSRLIGALFVMLISAGSSAQDNEQKKNDELNVNGKTIPVYYLEQVKGNSDLDQDSFAKMVGQKLVKYSTENKTEACARICRATDGTWGALPLSVGAHIMCPIPPICPEKMDPVGATIHSHPLEKNAFYLSNNADAVLGGRVGKLMKAGDPDTFSKEDYASPGYVITTRGNLYYQARRGRARKVE